MFYLSIIINRHVCNGTMFLVGNQTKKYSSHFVDYHHLYINI